MIEALFSGMPWILGAIGAYRAALAIGNTGAPGTRRAKLVQLLGGGGPGVRA